MFVTGILAVVEAVATVAEATHLVTTATLLPTEVVQAWALLLWEAAMVETEVHPLLTETSVGMLRSLATTLMPGMYVLYG